MVLRWVFTRCTIVDFAVVTPWILTLREEDWTTGYGVPPPCAIPGAPSSVPSYMQDAGRKIRDGRTPAECGTSTTVPASMVGVTCASRRWEAAAGTEVGDHRLGWMSVGLGVWRASEASAPGVSSWVAFGRAAVHRQPGAAGSGRRERGEPRQARGRERHCQMRGPPARTLGPSRWKRRGADGPYSGRWVYLIPRDRP